MVLWYPPIYITVNIGRLEKTNVYLAKLSALLVNLEVHGVFILTAKSSNPVTAAYHSLLFFHESKREYEERQSRCLPDSTAQRCRHNTCVKLTIFKTAM